MVKKNQIPELEKNFYSCVARRTRANTHVYIEKVAEQLNKDRKQKAKRRVIVDDIVVTEISEDSGADVVQKMVFDVKKKTNRKCVFYNDDSGGLRSKREVAHHSGLGVSDDDDDDDMGFDVKKSPRSGRESVSRNQQYEAGESSVLKTKNREDLAESDADAYLSSPSTASSDKDDSDYRMTCSEPDSDDKSGSFVGEEDDDNDDDDEEKPQHYQKRFKVATEYASVETSVSSDDILMEDEVKPEPVSSDECIIIEGTESVKLDESCSSKREDESPIQIMDSDDEIVLESLVRNVHPFTNIGVVETKNVDAEKKIKREKIDETLGSCNNNSNTNVVKESRFTENVYLNDNCVESGLNKVNTVKESEIKKLHESRCHIVAQYFDEQKSRKCDHEVEQASKTSVNAEEKKIKCEKIDETLGSCNNNNNTNVKESRFTENVYLNDNYVESGLNIVNAVKESEIKKFHESRCHILAQYFDEQKSRKCDHEIEQASKTSVNVEKKNTAAASSAEEFLRTSGVDNDGEPKNGATVEEEKKGLNIESFDDRKLKHEVIVEDEKISEVISSGAAPEVRMDVTFSDACEFRLTEQDEPERKPFSSKYDSENVPDQLNFTSGVLEEIPVEKASEELESVRHWPELYCALAGEELDLVSPLEGEQV